MPLSVFLLMINNAHILKHGVSPYISSVVFFYASQSSFLVQFVAYGALRALVTVAKKKAPGMYSKRFASTHLHHNDKAHLSISLVIVTK